MGKVVNGHFTKQTILMEGAWIVQLCTWNVMFANPPLYIGGE